jgi:carboxypeptidase PM20D1
MRTILAASLAAIAALAAVLAFNTLRLPALPPAPAGMPADASPATAQAAAERLAEAIRIPTISRGDGTATEATAFTTFAALLARHYPDAHRVMRREVIADHSLLFTWPGRDRRRAPALLLAHLDVVPVEPGTEDRWTHPPFAGVIADGHVWGRGAIDDKASVMALMEAAQTLAATGWQPPQDLLFAFGHDEETGGTGARAIAATLKARGMKAAFLLDEGGALTTGIVPGVTRPVATIMAAEKGYLSLRLTASAVGGHSSQPPPETAISRLARALVRLQDQPLPARLAAPVDVMLERTAPAMGLANRVAIANLWLFEPLLLRLLAGAPATNALIRTTTAQTMLAAGVKDNVLPAEARAVINFRLLPGDTADTVAAHVRRVIADDGIAISREGAFASEASTVSDPDAPAFRHLDATTRALFPDAVVTTGLVLGATDARHYAGLYEQRYHFLPITLDAADLRRIHGSDERVSVAGYARAITWYRRLLETLP